MEIRLVDEAKIAEYAKQLRDKLEREGASPETDQMQNRLDFMMVGYPVDKCVEWRRLSTPHAGRHPAPVTV